MLNSLVSIAVSVCKEHQEKLDANAWFKEVAAPCKGRGGGRGGNVAGTGQAVEGFDACVEKAEQYIASLSL